MEKKSTLLQWNNQRVMTTEMLTECFKTGKKNIHVNFRRNKDRFIEGKHYYLLKGRELGIFKNFVNVVDKRTPSLMLWTFDGCLVHADLLENSRNFIDKMFEYFDCDKVYVKQTKRKELEFGEMLEKVTGFHFVRQYPMCNNKYRIDFILEDASLMIEYDEEYHETEKQKQKDEERIKECREWLKENVYFEDWDCPVIRVKKGYELEGLREIIEHLVAYETLTNWDYKCIRNVGESRLP